MRIEDSGRTFKRGKGRCDEESLPLATLTLPRIIWGCGELATLSREILGCGLELATLALSRENLGCGLKLATLALSRDIGKCADESDSLAERSCIIGN